MRSAFFFLLPLLPLLATPPALGDDYIFQGADISDFPDHVDPGCLALLPEYAYTPRASFQGSVQSRPLRSSFRSDWTYESELGGPDNDRFMSRLIAVTRMGLDGHVIDLGPGVGRTLEEYLLTTALGDDLPTHARRARVTAVDIEPAPDWYRTHFTDGRYRDPYWRRFEGQTIIGAKVEAERQARWVQARFDAEDFDPSTLGQGDLVTDIYGPLSYTHRLDVTLARELSLLKPGGSLFVAFDAKSTIIYDRTGKAMDLAEWLATIPGIKLTPLRPGNRRNVAFEITLDPAVPLRIRPLKRVYIKDVNPAERAFTELH